ncbi:hypothetical protein C8R45DRAFT_373471 [Mycena sanguinolenta]|nr:hypothetical protein C8R45DRAFT_373471 [Mycena sanguinolenta]
MSDVLEQHVEFGVQDPTARLATDFVLQNVPIDPQQNRGSERRDEESQLTRKIGFLTATASEDWTLLLDVCDHASATDVDAKEAARALRREFKYGEPNAQLAAARLWAFMLRNSSDVFVCRCMSRKFLDTLEDLLTSSHTSPVVRERVMDVLAAAAYASGPEDSGFRGLWRRVRPHDKPEEGVPLNTETSFFSRYPPFVSTYNHDTLRCALEAAREVKERRRRIREREYEEIELTRKIGFLTATASDDWTLILDVCDHASATEMNAKEAVRALRREFKYGEPAAQLSAARLWAIMLRNSSDVFVYRCTSRKFLDTLEDLLTSPRTSLIVRERVMVVLGAAAYASGSGKDTSFRGLWRRVKPHDKPEEGMPFDSEDPWMNLQPPFASACDYDTNRTTASVTPIVAVADPDTIIPIVSDTAAALHDSDGQIIPFDDDNLPRATEEERDLPQYIDTGKDLSPGNVPPSPPAYIQLPQYTDVEQEDCSMHPDAPTKVGSSPPAYMSMSTPQSQHSARRRVWQWPAKSLVRLSAFVRRLLGLRRHRGSVVLDNEKYRHEK